MPQTRMVFELRYIESRGENLFLKGEIWLTDWATPSLTLVGKMTY